MKVFTLDIASQTGWAVGSHETKVVEFGSIRLGRDGATLVEKADGLWCWLWQMLDRHLPSLFVFEAPILPKAGWHKGKIRQATNLGTVRTLSGMALVAELCAVQHNRARNRSMEIAEADAPRWRDYFLGHVPQGREAIARAVFDMCKMRGWNPADGDQASALGILDYALSVKDPVRAVRVTPMFSALEEDQGRCRLQAQTNASRSRASSSTGCRGRSNKS